MLRVNEKIAAFEIIKKKLNEFSLLPQEINPYLESLGSSPIDQKTKALPILTRPNVTLIDIIKCNSELQQFISVYDQEILESAEIELKYEGYIKKEKELVDKMSRLEEVKLLENYDYKSIKALSNEAKVKLSQVKPTTIGQASRISGVSPADISVLLVHMGR